MTNTKNRILEIFALLSLAFFAGCDVSTQDRFISEYVVEAYLFAGEDMPDVRISRTVPFGTAYNFDEQAVSGATVNIRLLDENGALVREHPYTEVFGRGVYSTPFSSSQVEPRGVYELEVNFANDGTVLRATTIVPDTFSIVSTMLDTIPYLATEQLEVDVTPSLYPGRQNMFIFSTEAEDVRYENLTPFLRDIIDEDESIEEFRINESPIINEGNFDVNPNGTITIRVPWIAIAFLGKNTVTINAVDDNIFDFITSQNIQAMPSTLSPGEIPNVVDNIEGGTGVFGSFARVSSEIFVSTPR